MSRTDAPAIFEVTRGKLTPIGTRLVFIGIEETPFPGEPRCLYFRRPGGGRRIDLYPAAVRAINQAAHERLKSVKP